MPEFILGTGITPFGAAPNASLRSLAHTASQRALADAGLTASDVDAVYFGNAMAGLIDGQEMIRGQVALRDLELRGVPLVNVENACATGTTAFQLALNDVGSGRSHVALVVGAEKMTHDDKSRTFTALASASDLERQDQLKEWLYREDGARPSGSLMMDIYSKSARAYALTSGASPRDFATVAVKNRTHAALNPNARFSAPITVDEVLASRLISDPLTLLMCSAVANGAAALVVVSEEFLSRYDHGPVVRVLGSQMATGLGDEDPTTRATELAYAAAGIDPGDIDVVELHDAAAPAELALYEDLGLCGRGAGPRLLASGATHLGGSVPVNPSGGLLGRGHPVGATGVAQLVELTNQLRGRAGDHQVPGARVGVAENGGGFLTPHAAVATVTVLRSE